MTDPNQTDDSKNADSLADDWASAMAEQAAPQQEAAPETLADAAEDDPWAAALAEQAAADTAVPKPSSNAGESVFKPLDKGTAAGGMRDLEMIMDIPVRLSVELGRTRITIKQLLELAQGSVVELDGLAGEPMDILINGYLIAQGEVVVVDDKYGIRITEIVTPSERVQKLNR